MGKQGFEYERRENIEYLNSILEIWCGEERRQRKVLAFVLAVCAIAVYWFFSDVFGHTFGYFATIALVGVGAYSADRSGYFETKDGLTDGKLAYHACVTMEILVEIEKGTYKKYGYHSISIGTGRHCDLYKQFIQFYPKYKCKALKKMANTNIEYKDTR